MRTTFKFSALVHFTLLLTSLFLTLALPAQNIWKGGTPGSETDWNQPKNWSQNHIPDWTDDAVVIPNVMYQSGVFPVISSKVPDIAYLSIEGGAHLTIESTGALIIDGKENYNHGVLNIGQIYNSGQLTIMNTALAAFSNSKKNIHNDGELQVWDPNEAEQKTPVAASPPKNF